MSVKSWSYFEWSKDQCYLPTECSTEPAWDKTQETTSKVTQTVAEFEFNGKKRKLHLYHTNHSGLIQGSNHDMFYKQFSLGPAPRQGRFMVLMCVSVPPPEAWTFRYLLDTLDL